VVVPGKSCTNVLVSAGASLDGSPLLAYNADSGSLYGSVGLFPAKTHTPNTTREVWSWDDAVFLGTIPEAETTYNVIGNANQFGLVIGETTFGGLPELDCHDSGGVMDYGSLIWITLQRCKTCDCAITTIDDLVQTHGYASDGESFSCVDTTR
jgi:dipeptidase|tara:strand:- start:27 stop:485 length:459 start_codon:yes stop_codon:yes gene_type:complete